MSGAINPRFNSQSRKPSPASGAHRVPSQSNTATRGSRRSTESRKAARSGLETSIVLGCIHIECGVGVVHGNVEDAVLVLVLDFAGVGGERRAQKSLHHFAVNQHRVTVFFG